MKKQLLSILVLLVFLVPVSSLTAGINLRYVETDKHQISKSGEVYHLPQINPMQFTQFVGAKIDPVDSTIVYDMYGSAGALSSIIILKVVYNSRRPDIQ